MTGGRITREKSGRTDAEMETGGHVKAEAEMGAIRPQAGEPRGSPELPGAGEQILPQPQREPALLAP